MLELFLKRRCR